MYTRNLCAVVGKGDTEAKLCLQEEKIFDVKQQMSTMLQRIGDLKDENEELKIRHSTTNQRRRYLHVMCTSVISNGH